MSEIERPTPKSARLDTGYAREPQDVIEAASRAASKLRGWSIVYQDGYILRAVRTTRLLRFKDDITAEARPGERAGHSRLQLHSASRVGLGDLGQNRRNLRELTETLKSELG